MTKTILGTLKPPRPKPWKISQGLIALVLSLSVFSQAADLDARRDLLALNFLAILLVAYLLSGVLVFKIFAPALAHASRKTAWFAVLVSLLAGFYLVATIPLTIYPKPQIIKITATGKHNPSAKSSEVWLTGITTGDAALFSLAGVCKGSWSQVDTVLVSLGEHQPATLICRLETTDDIQLEFGRHPWSGEIRLYFNQRQLREDLYSPAGEQIRVNLSVPLTRVDRAIWLLLFLADGFSIAVLLLAGVLFLQSWAPKKHPPPPRWRLGWLGWSVAILLTWIGALLAFWPGFFSPDAINQYQQIATGQFTDWHPVFHTLFMWLPARLWFSPASNILVQMIALSLLVGGGLSIFRRWGLPVWVGWLIALFYALSPALVLFMLNPWKDTAFSIAILALTLLSLDLLIKDALGAAVRKWHWVLITLVAAAVALFRHNGVLVGFGALLGLWLVLTAQRRALTGALIASVVLYLVIKVPLYSLLRVDTTPETGGENLVAVSQTYFLIRHLQLSGAAVDPADLQVIGAIHFDDGRVRIADLAENNQALTALALKLSLRNPAAAFDYFLDRTAFVFQALQPPGKFFGYVELKVYPNIFGIASASRLPGVVPRLEKIIAHSERPAFNWFFWRNAFWMDLFILAVVVVCLRQRSWKFLVLIIPILLNAIPYVFIARSQARYLMPTLMIAPLLSAGLFFLRLRVGDPEAPRS